MFLTLEVELHLDLAVAADEGPDGGGGTLRCRPSRPGGLPCPAATGRVRITEATGIGVVDETMGRSFSPSGSVVGLPPFARDISSTFASAP